MAWFEPDHSNKLDSLERVALGLMAAIVLLTFVGTNLQAILWQSSDWLVGTVLPAVVVDLTNDERSDIAAAPLRRSASLDAAAAAKAQHMAANSYFAHFAPDGTSPWFFFDQAGYTYAHAGENLAIHFTDSAQLVDAWMQSPAHKDNIVNRDYTEIGVGTARGTFDGYETIFVVQLFGTPAVAPVVTTTPAPAPVLAQASAPTAPEADSTAEQVVAGEQTSVNNTEREATLQAIKAQLETVQQQADVLQTESNSTQTPPPLPIELPQPLATEETLVETILLSEAPPVLAETEPHDVLVIETELATSSGLAVASIVEPYTYIPEADTGAAAAASIATRPNLVLDIVYSVLVGLVLVLLCAALVGEARRLHYAQAAYSVALLGGVGCLWYVHTALTGGAVVL